MENLNLPESYKTRLQKIRPDREYDLTAEVAERMTDEQRAKFTVLIARLAAFAAECGADFDLTLTPMADAD